MTIDKLDFTKPPRGYISWRYIGPPTGDARGSEYTYQTPSGEEVESLAAAWSDHEAHNDPPGVRSGWYRGSPPMACVHVGDRCVVTEDGGEDEARAAAWAWYKRRLALSKAISEVAQDCEACGGEAVPREVIAAHEGVCSYVSHDVRDDGGGRCNTCGAALEACMVCGTYRGRKPPLGDHWPRCLTWTDEQVAEVEAWTGDTSKPQPAANPRIIAAIAELGEKVRGLIVDHRGFTLELTPDGEGWCAGGFCDVLDDEGHPAYLNAEGDTPIDALDNYADRIELAERTNTL